MIRNVKFYIPVMTGKSSFTMLRADKVKEIKEVLPSKEQIYAYAKDQINGDGFESIKIKVKPDTYTSICKELKRKCNHFNGESSIDLVLNKNSYPIIQIIK